MEKVTIQRLVDEIEAYKQAIQNAQDALDAAEREIDEALEEEFEKENAPRLSIMK